MNLPWEVVDLADDWAFQHAGTVILPWGIADRWGYVIGRFDTQQQAKQAVDAVNEFFTVHAD